VAQKGKNLMARLLRFALLLLVLCSPAAFAKSKLMTPASQQEPKPAEGKALVVFMRPSFYGGAISSSIYDAPDGGTTFLGVLKYKDKVAVQMDPGVHRLMVIAENADFLDATFEAGKTYYVLVKARPGVWKARFSLIPVHNKADAEYSLQMPDFAEWTKGTSFVEKTGEADAWYEENKVSVEEKKTDYLVKWNKMLPEERAELVLNAEDGV
jgi:hypothetical protein